MKKSSLFLLFFAQFIFSVAVINAQSKDDEVVGVEELKVEDVRGTDDWAMFQVAVKAKVGTSKNNNLYTDDVKVTLYVAYMKGSDIERLTFYSSTVELVTLEKNKKYTIAFYMCGPVLKRERYNRKPYGAYVEIEVGGRKQKYSDKSMLNITATQLEKFLSMAIEGSKATEGILIPAYDLPTTVLPTPIFFKDSPAYRIRARK